MSGVAVIWQLLKANEPLTEVVPVANIKAGVLPLNHPMPAISIKSVDTLPRLTVEGNNTNAFVSERVQVTVLASSYPIKKDILALVRKALPLSSGIVGGIKVDSVLRDVLGPDLDDPETGVYEQSVDYFVRWNEQ